MKYANFLEDYYANKLCCFHIILDVFFITAEGYKQLHLEIYDRWGLKLWEVEGLNPSWDGRTSAGMIVPDGTYYYILTGIDFKNKAMEKTGYLSVVK
jgi:gliding motility-associated-like protein